jgi:hypothetical protein
MRTFKVTYVAGTDENASPSTTVIPVNDDIDLRTADEDALKQVVMEYDEISDPITIKSVEEVVIEPGILPTVLKKEAPEYEIEKHED